MTHTAACLMGALTADAAALGLHWVYDPARIATVAAARGQSAFTPADPTNFVAKPAYFVHGNRPNGALTQYGEVLHLAIQSLIATKGVFSEPQYQAAYTAHFGPGGPYVGYIDRPTRGTLANLAAGQTNPSGVDDDQHPATATLPAIVVATLGAPNQTADQTTTLTRAMRVTNVNDTATAYGLAFASLLSQVLQGSSVASALHATAAAAKGDLGARLTQALNSPQSSTDYGETTGRACHLPMGLPLAFHILANTTSFADAVEANIRAGGDSAGRAILIGAVMGAAHGIGGAAGIPADYLVKLHNSDPLWQHCQALATLSQPTT